MKKKIFLIVLFLPFFNQFFPKIHTNKTFLQPRPIIENLSMELSCWYSQIGKSDYNQISLQVIPFYQKSTNKSNIGDYFGYFAEQEGRIRDFISVAAMPDADPAVAPSLVSDDIHVNYLIHNPQSENMSVGGRITFRPSQESYGIRLGYYQSLEKFFLKLDTAIVRVKNNLNLWGIDQLISDEVDENVNKNILDFFEGNLEVQSFDDRLQRPLSFAKFGNSLSRRGFADIEIAFGFSFLDDIDNKISAAINLTIPTGNKADGVYLFEPIYGNGRHFALGLRADSKFKIWEKEESEKLLELLVNLKLKYLFKNSQKRTVGLVDDNGEKIRYGHYFLGGKRGEFPVFPLANILTMDLDVEPGIQFEGFVAFAFKCGNFLADLGYNIFAKDSENISLKHEWDQNTYAVASPGDAQTDEIGYLTELGLDPENGPFDPTNAAHYDQNTISGPIEQKHLDFKAASTPNQFTNKIHGGFGYIFNKKTPIIVGIGASYEFVSSNSALEKYAFWGKISFLF
ncbi:hypothetical protein KAT08_03155 [Candidatus Babeliales bacterium]|nr:hypothetical protein [Candidatus Babeliales bacterium]